MNFDLDKAFAFLNGLYGIPAASLILVLCLFAGFIFKRTPWIPNGSIPILICLVGAVGLPLISDFKSSTVESVRVFFVKQAFIGFIAGALAWVIHRFGIKPLLKKFGVPDNGDTKPPIVPAAPVSIAIGLLLFSCGCRMVPNSWNYTVSVDHQTGETTSYIGIGGPLPWAK